MQPRTRRFLIVGMMVISFASALLGMSLPPDSLGFRVFTLVVPMGLPALVILAVILLRPHRQEEPRLAKWVFALVPIAILIVATAPMGEHGHFSTQTRIGFGLILVALAVMLPFALKENRTGPVVPRSKRGIWFGIGLGALLVLTNIPEIINPPSYKTHPWAMIMLASGLILTNAVQLSTSERVQKVGLWLWLPFLVTGFALIW